MISMPTQQQETIDFIASKGFDIPTIIGLKTALKSADFQEFLIPHTGEVDASFESEDIAAGELQRNMLIHSDGNLEVLKKSNATHCDHHSIEK